MPLALVSVALLGASFASPALGLETRAIVKAFIL